MHSNSRPMRGWLGVLGLSLLPLGCNAVLGIDNPTLASASGGSAGSAGSSAGDGGEPTMGGAGGGSQGGSVSKGGSAGAGGNAGTGGDGGDAGTGGSGGSAGSGGGGGTGRVCGNGKVEYGEQCDDGDTSPFDGCSADCWRESRLAVGYYNTCVMLRTGVVKCWGSGSSRILGIDDTVNNRGDGPDEMGINMPRMEYGANWLAGEVSSSTSFACVRSTVGTLKCWGMNQYGWLGLGDVDPRGDTAAEMGDALEEVDLGTDFVVDVLTVGGHSCAISTTGVLKCWGDNYAGQLGIGDTNAFGDNMGEMGDVLPSVDLGDNFVPIRVNAGNGHTCAVSKAGKLKCWGSNDVGQLGYGDIEPRGVAPGQMGNNLPPVDLGSDFVAMDVACGGVHTCALSKDHKVKCWGSNYEGELGQGDGLTRGDNADEMGDNLPPIDLGTDFTPVSLSLGWSVSCAVSAEGTAKCWGDNVMGQLGQGDKIYRGDGDNEMGDNLLPINLGSGFAVTQIDTWQFHVCALSAAGAVKCWGTNYYGELGQGDTNPRGGMPNEMGNLLLPVELE